MKGKGSGAEHINEYKYAIESVRVSNLSDISEYPGPHGISSVLLQIKNDFDAQIIKSHVISHHEIQKCDDDYWWKKPGIFFVGNLQVSSR